MDKQYDFIYEFKDFLDGTFYQDINSPEEALDYERNPML
ncbi:hypothetical protein SAMN05428981_10111 [Bacillus sp. OV194]|nr:hypothetical protein SAMN05428981_10111 [Bacillus sp. OV194]